MSNHEARALTRKRIRENRSDRRAENERLSQLRLVADEIPEEEESPGMMLTRETDTPAADRKPA